MNSMITICFIFAFECEFSQNSLLTWNPQGNRVYSFELYFGHMFVLLPDTLKIMSVSDVSTPLVNRPYAFFFLCPLEEGFLAHS